MTKLVLTKGDVIRMACKAGFMAYGNHDVYATHDDLQRFAAMVAAAEREACASLVAEMRNKSRNPLFRSALSIAAGEIRASNKPPVQTCCAGGPQWGHAWDCKGLP